MKTPREKNMRKRRMDPMDFDLVELLTAAGDEGASLPSLTIMARQVSNKMELTEDDVREQLQGLLKRGLVAAKGGRWTIR